MKTNGISENRSEQHGARRVELEKALEAARGVAYFRVGLVEPALEVNVERRPSPRRLAKLASDARAALSEVEQAARGFAQKEPGRGGLTMATTTQQIRGWRPNEKLHRAFLAIPETTGGGPERDLLRVAREFGISPRDARHDAVWGEWYLEREALRARAWAAERHPGAPLELEAFAAHVAAGMYSHLPLPQGLAMGRCIWFRALACVPHWEAASALVEANHARQDKYAARDAANGRA